MGIKGVHDAPAKTTQLRGHFFVMFCNLYVNNKIKIIHSKHSLYARNGKGGNNRGPPSANRPIRAIQQHLTENKHLKSQCILYEGEKIKQYLLPHTEVKNNNDVIGRAFGIST